MVLSEPHKCPTRVYDGASWWAALVSLVADRRWALVTSKGWLARAQEILSEFRPQPAAIVTVEPNPTISESLRHFGDVKPEKPDVLVALGGGSVIDAAKAILALIGVDGESGAFKRHLEQQTPLALGALPTLIAIPTTAGTGSEVTRWGTIWGDAGEKYSVVHEDLYPETAILDPSLTVSQTAEMTVAGGLDALSHALEAIWNKNAGPISDQFAIQAIRLILGNLEPALIAPENIEARQPMQIAALFAGWAMGHTKTALAHSISYPFTASFGLPHGIACSFTLGEVARFNFDTSPQRAHVVADLFGCAPADLPEELNKWLAALGVGRYLHKYLPDDAVDQLSGRLITPARAKNNLRFADDRDATQIVRKSMAYLLEMSSR